MGSDTFMLSRQAATGFSGSGTLTADAMEEAKRYCSGLKKELQVVSTKENHPPYIFGNFPKTEIQFMCLNAGDPALRTTAIPVSVSIESEPSGADVYLDGSFIGNTPLPNYGVSPGEHVLEITRKGSAKWSRKILIQISVPTHVKATLEPSPAP